MLGTGVKMVAFLELLLAAYSVALIVNTDKKALKIIHSAIGIMWVVLALMNMFA